MIPIRDENPTSRTAWVTLAFIALNVAAFLFWQPTFEGGQQGELEQTAFFFCHAEIPWEVLNQENLARGGTDAARAIEASGLGVPGPALQGFLGERCPGKSWLLSVFVAMFLHGGWLHIAGNMLFLWVFGNNVEDRMGHAVYPFFYLLGGVVASAAHIATDPDSVIPTLGASGAVAAVLGAYLVMYPRHRVLSLVPVFYFLHLIELPAVVVLGFWFVLQLFSGVGSLASDVSQGVAYWAHIGGFVAGAAVAWLFFRRGPSVRSPRPIW
ncbi:MAG: rhomboid family intramembrane serine protease [Actinobacteria bacterium]|nr:rhomboid family intramembrane serine protease [Actinomycetota bacterium]